METTIEDDISSVLQSFNIHLQNETITGIILWSICMVCIIGIYYDFKNAPTNAPQDYGKK